MAYLLQRLEKKKNCETILKRSYNHSLGLPDEGINPVNTIGATLESTNLATSSIAPQNVNVIENLVTNYDNEAENLIRAFINNKDAVNQIVVYLKGQNPEYIKELVLNWDSYKPIFLDLRGKDLSIGRVADQLAGAIGANVNQKAANELIVANPNRVPMLTNGPNHSVPPLGGPRPGQSQPQMNSNAPYTGKNDDFTKSPQQLQALEDLYFKKQSETINDKWECRDVLRHVLADQLNNGVDTNDSHLKFLFIYMTDAQYDQLSAYYDKVYKLGMLRDDIIRGILLLVHKLNLSPAEQETCINMANEKLGSETYLRSDITEIINEELRKSSTFFLANLTEAITEFSNMKVDTAENKAESATKALEETKEEHSKSVAWSNKFKQIEELIRDNAKVWPDTTERREKKGVINKFFRDAFSMEVDLGRKWTPTAKDGKSILFIVQSIITNKDKKYTDEQIKSLVNKFAEITADVINPKYRIMSYDENIGLGLTSSAKHRFGDKGKFYIDSKVLDGGLLEIRYTKNGHLANIKSVMVSRKLKDIICGLLAGRSVDHSEYLKLTPSEKHIISLVSAKFGQGLNEGADHDLNNEFEILKGELMGGNNSVLIKTKLRHMIYLQADTGKISRQSANKMIADLGLT
jgi:uncharacterized protein (UPF0297 family)